MKPRRLRPSATKRPIKRLALAVALGLVVLPDAAFARPNVVLVLADDSGFSDLGCFGGEIQTPNLDNLGTNGLRYAQFYNTARCSPTRASLMTGLYSWQAGIGHLVEDHPQSGYTPALNRKCVTMAEVLKSEGYGTYIAGKWHIGGRETNQLPLQRGFDHYFGTLVTGGGSLPSGSGYYGTSYWLDNTFLTGLPSGVFSSDRFTDYALQFLQDHVAQTNAPFFLYLAFTAPHFDLTEPPEGNSKYRNTFTNGWEVHRQQRFARQQALGIVRTNWVLSPPDHSLQWNNLTPAEKDTQDYAMATHCAMVENIDKNVGRVVDFLKDHNLYTNTVIFFLSDNGASNEGGSGGLSTTTRLSTVGANWSNTPWRLYKKFVREGGVSTPLIVHWQGRITQPAIRWQPGHVIDLMPTVLELAGATYPGMFHGNPILPLEGTSLVPTFTNSTVLPRTLFFEHEGNRAVRSNDWKLVSIGRNTLSWELFDLANDRSETTDVSGLHPDVAAGLSNAWESMAWRVNDLPSPDVNNYVKMRSWITVDDSAGGDGDGQPEPGETVDLIVETIKRGSGPDTGLTGLLSSMDTNVTVLTGGASYGSFAAGRASNLTPFQIQISSNAPVNQSLLFSLQLNQGAVEQWGDVLALVARSFARVDGQVIEEGTDAAVRGASVAAGMLASAASDAFGNYRLLLETGPYLLSASMDGYAPTQRVESVLTDRSDEDFHLLWTNDGLHIRMDRPFPDPVIIPTNTGLLLRSTVHNGPYPGSGSWSVAWSAVSGPAQVQLESPSSEDTAARFPVPGEYTLQLAADNGGATVTQMVNVVVVTNGVPPPSTNEWVAHLALDDSPGATVAADSTGYGHTGALINMDVNSAWTNGVIAGALDLDGVDDVVGIATSTLINNQITPQRTVSVWFRSRDPARTAKQTVYEEGGSTRGLHIYLAGGLLYVGGWNRDAAQSDWSGDWMSTSAVNADQWHHAALVLDGGATVQPDALTGYLDGAEIGRVQGSQLWNRTDAIGLGATYDASRFHDGTTVGQVNGAWFDGTVDDLRIYNRSLSPVEIAALADASPYSRVVALSAGPDLPLHSGLNVPLVPQAEPLGPPPYPLVFEWLTMAGPDGSEADFSLPDSNLIPTLATLSQAGQYTLRLTADTGDSVSYDDVNIGAIRSFEEWIDEFPSLSPEEQLPAADPDNDDGSNDVEYELNTPPDCSGCSDASSRTGLQVSNAPPSTVQLSVRLRRGALDRDLVLGVERTPELFSAPWTNCPHTISAISDTEDFEFQGILLDLQLTPQELSAPQQAFRVTFQSNSSGRTLR